LKRKLSLLVLAFALLLPIAQAAAVPPGFAVTPTLFAGTPRYVYLTLIIPGLSVSGTTASYSLDADGSSAVTSIAATLQLQKQNSNGTYSDYGTSWTVSDSDNSLYTSGTKTVASGGTYKLKTVVTAYTANGSDTATAYSS
jgi:hypothetical protein